jgi:hypothetical protein
MERQASLRRADFPENHYVDWYSYWMEFDYPRKGSSKWLMWIECPKEHLAINKNEPGKDLFRINPRYSQLFFQNSYKVCLKVKSCEGSKLAPKTRYFWIWKLLLVQIIWDTSLSRRKNSYFVTSLSSYWRAFFKTRNFAKIN